MQNMRETEVFDGCQLHREPVKYPVSRETYRLSLCGLNAGNSPVYVPIDEEVLSRHMLLLGGIGTGKTNTFMQMIKQLRQNLTEQDVMIVFDTKGDFHKQFYQGGDVVISNDDLSCGAMGKDYWNIFYEITLGEHIEDDIIEISNTLFQKAVENTNQPFFPNAAKDIFGAVLTYFCINRKNVTCNNQSLKAFLSRTSVEDLKKMLQSSERFRYMTNYISNEKSAQTQGVLSELYQVVNEFFIGNFNKAGSISLRNLVRQKGGRCVFIEYDMGIGNMLSPIYSLMFDMAIKEALCRKKSEGNVYFIVDEFSLLPHLQHIEDAVNFGRSLGVKFMVGIQNISQIYNNYGEDRTQSMLSGFLTNITFNVNDYVSRQYIKNLYGVNRKKETYMGAMQNRGVVEEIREANVVEDWDITSLGRGEAIIGLPGAEPFTFRFARFQ